MKKHTSSEIIVVITLITAAVAYRVATGEIQERSAWLPNFSPMAALVLCGAVFLPLRAGVALTLSVLFFSDVILNWLFNAPLLEVSMITRYIALGALAAGGVWLRKNPVAWKMFAASFAGSVLFYVTTNTGSWLTLGYEKTFAGWVQALTTGLPDVQPQAWVFFRNSAISDLIFTAMILACVAAVREKETESQMTGAF
jgi:hypothetical protein